MLHFKELDAMEEDSYIKNFELCKIKDMHITDLSRNIAGLQKKVVDIGENARKIIKKHGHSYCRLV